MAPVAHTPQACASPCEDDARRADDGGRRAACTSPRCPLLSRPRRSTPYLRMDIVWIWASAAQPRRAWHRPALSPDDARRHSRGLGRRRAARHAGARRVCAEEDAGPARNWGCIRGWRRGRGMGTCLCHDHLPASPLADFCASFVSAALCTISTACTSRWDAPMCMPDGGWRAPWSTADLGARTALEERAEQGPSKAPRVRREGDDRVPARCTSRTPPCAHFKALVDGRGRAQHGTLEMPSLPSNVTAGRYSRFARIPFDLYRVENAC
ncbi:hypothetical protein VTO73DRAFT_13943 [Trametes versicolor]